MMSMATDVISHVGWGPGLWWPIFPLFWLLLWGAVIVAFLRFRRGGRWQHRHGAEEVLAERYARGEIGVDEYRERLAVLKDRPA